ncbi:MAG: carboxypeptidase regulatory-like domain-containing protein [Candidatus Acidiferrales bacterium]
MRRTWNCQFVVLIAIALMVTGCGSNAHKAALLPLAPPVDPTTAASIAGTVKFQGKAPVLAAIDMSASPACVKANPSPVVPPVVVTGAHDALANVVVFVKSGLGRYRYLAPQTPVNLDQKGCMYVPRVVALMVGQPFQVANHDLTLHDVHPMLHNNASWDESQLPGSAPVKATFSKPEFATSIGCMIHPWMEAYLFVFNQPYFAVTSKDGTFALKNLPPGTYTIEAWHEKNEPIDQTVVLGPKESKAISFTFGASTVGG